MYLSKFFKNVKKKHFLDIGTHDIVHSEIDTLLRGMVN